jgi:hypothetical protein
MTTDVNPLTYAAQSLVIIHRDKSESQDSGGSFHFLPRYAVH